MKTLREQEIAKRTNEQLMRRLENLKDSVKNELLSTSEYFKNELLKILEIVEFIADVDADLLTPQQWKDIEIEVEQIRKKIEKEFE